MVAPRIQRQRHPCLRAGRCHRSGTLPPPQCSMPGSCPSGSSGHRAGAPPSGCLCTGHCWQLMSVCSVPAETPTLWLMCVIGFVWSTTDTSQAQHSQQAGRALNRRGQGTGRWSRLALWGSTSWQTSGGRWGRGLQPEVGAMLWRQKYELQQQHPATRVICFYPLRHMSPDNVQDWEGTAVVWVLAI